MRRGIAESFGIIFKENAAQKLIIKLKKYTLHFNDGNEKVPPQGFYGTKYSLSVVSHLIFR